MAKPDPPCQAQACSLHDCLNKNTYDPDKCSRQLKQLYVCCDKMYTDAGKVGKEEDAESTACPMPSVVRRWLKKNA